ncbi:MAG: hypothetical protein ABW208_07260 [Pyrinomonadaceae bacterium]
MNKNFIWRAFLLTFCMLAFNGCAREIKPVEPATKIETLADFERSSFHYTYGLVKEKGWALNTGEFNNPYKSRVIPNVTIDVPSRGDKVGHYGLSFYKRQTLSQTDLDFIYALLHSIDTTMPISTELKEYIKTNAERRVFQVTEAEPTTFSGYKVFAGKVGAEQVISLDSGK